MLHFTGKKIAGGFIKNHRQFYISHVLINDNDEIMLDNTQFERDCWFYIKSHSKSLKLKLKIIV